MPLNSVLITPRFAFEMCDQRSPTSKAWRLRVLQYNPPPPLAMKLKLEVFPGGRFELVMTAPPDKSI
jgi:hypothetical protein